jgi:hypothetical protein
MKVHLDHAGVRSHLEHMDARVMFRRSALDDHRHCEFRGRLLDACDEIEKILGFLHRREEDMDASVARLQAQGGAGDPRRGFPRYGFPLQRLAGNDGSVIAIRIEFFAARAIVGGRLALALRRPALH